MIASNDIKPGVILRKKYEHGDVYYGLKMILFADAGKVIFMNIGNLYWNDKVYFSKGHDLTETLTLNQFIDYMTINGYEIYKDIKSIDSLWENKIECLSNLSETIQRLYKIKKGICG